MSTPDPIALASATSKARRRLIPFLFLLYIVAYLDRVNVGFAALQMNEALGFSARTYGLGSGIFFLSYVAFEIPSNLILARVGARLWIARIMITWGLVSSAMMFVTRRGRVLHDAVPARRSRGRFLSRDHLLPDALVSRARACADARRRS